MPTVSVVGADTNLDARTWVTLSGAAATVTADVSGSGGADSEGTS
jgi:hypothetical protein